MANQSSNERIRVDFLSRGRASVTKSTIKEAVKLLSAEFDFVESMQSVIDYWHKRLVVRHYQDESSLTFAIVQPDHKIFSVSYKYNKAKDIQLNPDKEEYYKQSIALPSIIYAMLTEVAPMYNQVTAKNDSL